MYVCIYGHMYVCIIVCIYVCLCIVCMQVCIYYSCMHMYFLCMCVYILCVYVLCVYDCMTVCMYVCMYVSLDYTLNYLTFITPNFLDTRFLRVSPVKTLVDSSFSDGFLPHRTRSAHLLCTLSTTPLPVALLAIATRGAEQAHLLLFIKHGNTVTSARLSFRLSHVYHLSTSTMCSTLNGIPGKLNESRKLVRIYRYKQLVVVPSGALGGVT